MNAHSASLNSALDSNTRNSLAILENNSEKGVVGYVVKWTATRNGVSQSRYEVFDRLHLLEMRTIPTKYHWVSPHTYRVISPAFSMHETEAQTGTLAFAKQTNALTKSLESGTTFTPTLDMVIFEDSTYEGPDEGNMLPRIIAERNGTGAWTLCLPAADDL